MFRLGEANNSMKSQRRKEVVTLVVVFTGVLLVSALAVYFLGGGRRVTSETIQQDQPPNAVLGTPEARISPTPQVDTGDSFVDTLFGTHHNETYASGATWGETMGRLTLRLLLAALLGAALAFRRADAYSRSNEILTCRKHRFCWP